MNDFLTPTTLVLETDLRSVWGNVNGKSSDVATRLIFPSEICLVGPEAQSVRIIKLDFHNLYLLEKNYYYLLSSCKSTF